MDIQRFLRDYGIPFVTEGNSHCTKDWVNVHCPFCAGSKDFHLGIHESGIGAHCWRCGAHSVTNVLSKLTGLPVGKVREIMRKYGIRTRGVKKTEPKVTISTFRFPEPNKPLSSKPYLEYLEKRQFDPPKVMGWGLCETGPMSLLDGISYSHRILIPIRYDKEYVSFQARDITDRHERKYMACPKNREKIHHKNILYGRQEYWANQNGIIIVEGVTDVWRLGPFAAATFGIKFTTEQLLLIAKIPGRIWITFDREPQAQKQAKLLSIKLKALGREVYVEPVPEELGVTDPGGMKDEDATYFVQQLLNRRR